MIIKFVLIFLAIRSLSGSIFPALKPDYEQEIKPTESNDNVDCNNHDNSDFKVLNSLYLTNFEQKLTEILTVTKTMDTNIKALQEKAQVWDLYRHHIGAWDDHMKSLDHKIDLIKYSQDDTKSIDGKLTSLEFSINHILSKLVQIDGTTIHHRNDKILDDDFKKILKHLKNEKSENGIILNRLNNILRHILNIENSNSRFVTGIKNMKNTNLMHPINNDNTSVLQAIELKLDSLINNLSPKDIKQFVSSARKTTKSLEDILEVINNVDERTIRLFDAEAQHSTKYLNVCQSTTNEISTFTESSDLLLKRIETLVLNIKDKVEQIIVVKSTTESNEIDQEEIISKDSLENYNNDTITEREESQEDYNLPDRNFIQPSKKGCHELTIRDDGVYRFSSNLREFNVAGREFDERYCTFATDGVAWTVIQRRGPYDYQENFNRSWSDYRDGFGSLAKDFWFGNEFIHRLVYADNYELRIELEDFDGKIAWVEYSTFQIDTEEYNYNLLIGGYRGNVSDSMLYHQNQDFSTYDRRNDKTIDICCPCANGYGSGWWFDNCSEANLNGIYHETPLGHNFVGIVWEKWLGDYSLKKTRMLIRPKTFNETDDIDDP